MAETITIPLALAHLIDKAFLPLNPNKMRTTDAEVKAAAIEFKRLLRETALRRLSQP